MKDETQLEHLYSHMQDLNVPCTSKVLSELQNMVKLPSKHGEIPKIPGHMSN